MKRSRINRNEPFGIITTVHPKPPSGPRLDLSQMASDGLEGWPRNIRIALAAERALRNIGNVPREERDTDKEKP